METGGLSHEKAIEVNDRHHSTAFSCGSDGNMARSTKRHKGASNGAGYTESGNWDRQN